MDVISLRGSANEAEKCVENVAVSETVPEILQEQVVRIKNRDIHLIRSHILHKNMPLK